MAAILISELGGATVSERRDPSALRWLIGVELSNYRRQAQRSQAEAAKAAGVTPGMVGHFERGKYFPAPEQIARLLECYDAPHYDVERLSTLAGRADQRSWLARWDEVIPDWARTIVGLEGLASHETIYAQMVLPALLQTEPYSHGATESSARVRADQEQRLVKLRMERQHRVYSETNPLTLTALIEESVLDRPVGGAEVMRGQLEHLLEVGERDNVEIQLLPTALGRHDALDSRFLVLDFDEAQSIGYVEYLDGAVYVQDQDQVAAYTRTEQKLRAIALSAADSRAAIASRLRS